MGWIKQIYSILRSKTLTVWFTGLFILYYLTVAIWWKEAFALFIIGISKSYIIKFLYIVFLINIILRIADSVRSNSANTFRLITRAPLYIGIILFLVSFFMSLNVRQQRWIIVAERDSVDLRWEKKQFLVRKIDSALERKMLRMDNSLIFDFEPNITLMDRDRNLYEIGAFPPNKVGSSYMHILNFGIAPGIELKRDNRVLDRGYVIQRIVPFGSVDSFEIKPYPYKFYLRILPNTIVKKSGELARKYDLDSPNYGIEIVKGDKEVFEGESNDRVYFDKNMSLGFYKPINWIMLEAVYDPFYLWFIISLIILITGVVIYPISWLKKNSRV
jgi:hypothetical protein